MGPLGDKLILARDASGLPILAHVIRVAACLGPVSVAYGRSDVRDVVEPLVCQNVSWVQDTPGGEGPLPGVANALRTCQNQGDASFTLLAGDLPGIDVDGLQRCMTQFHATDADVDGVAIERDGRIQPLLATYQRDVGDVIRQAVEQGETRLMRVIAKLKMEPIRLEPHLEPNWRITPVHTPEDYQAWCKWQSEEVNRIRESHMGG